jgi:hypothetical protein
MGKNYSDTLLYFPSNMGLENRIVDIKRDIDKMYVILPFEKKILWR